MAYTITKTNGDTLVSVPDTELNTDYGINLVGRNYAGYGVYLNDNFVSLLENFANGTAPASPLEGQLWWDTTNDRLQVWQGSGWKILASLGAGTAAPTVRAVGDLWWDTTNEQLRAWAGTTTSNVEAVLSTTDYIVSLDSTDTVQIGDVITSPSILLANGVTVTQVLSSSNIRINTPASVTSGQTLTFTRGTGWNLVGPQHTKTQKLTGIYPRDVVDTLGVTHTVGLLYQKGFVVGAISRDNEYSPASTNLIDRLPVVRPGITLIDESAQQVVRGVMANAVTGGSITAGFDGNTVIQLTTTENLAVGDYIISSNIAYNEGTSIQEIYSNSSVRINATDVFVEDEVVTFQRGSDQSSLFYGTATNSQRLNGVTADKFATVSDNQTFQANLGVEGNLLVGRNGTTLTQVDGNLSIFNTRANGNIAVQTVIGALGGSATTVLSVNGLTGLVSVRGVPTTANGVATKEYVDNSQGTALAAITSNVTALINGAPVSRRDFGNVSTILTTYGTNISDINTALDTKAPLASPALTGTPTAPNASPGTNTEQIATTAFVTAATQAIRDADRANAAIQDEQILLRANIASPEFSGTPVVPHVLDSDRSRRIPTTQFVGNLVTAALNTFNTSAASKAPITSPALQGNPTAPTAANLDYDAISGFTTSMNLPISGGDSTIATTGFVANAIARMPALDLSPYATIASPTFTGVPRAPTAGAGTSSTQIATTEFVATRSPVLSVNNKVGEITLELSDITGVAPLASPTFTGAPAAPNPDSGEDSTRIATTAWVKDITDTLALASSPTFIGTVTVPNPTDGSNTTVAATTSWVRARIAEASVPKWGGARKWVSTAAPTSTDGTDGDIWFQYVL